MITIQHTLVTLLYFNGNIDKLKQYLPYMLMPDAIRYYLGRRQYSHFEKGLNAKVSWLEYPLDIKHINPNSLTKYLVDEKFIPNCCIGENTIISTYVEHNQHLPKLYYNGVLMHLYQDKVFDTFVRQVFDCSMMYDDLFYYNNKEYNGEQFRALIAKMEQQGVYVLAKTLCQKYGLITNQDWFDTEIYPVLQEVYSKELTQNTYKYMKIDENINEFISNRDFTHMDNFVIPQARLEDMYYKVQKILSAYMDI